MAAAAAQASKPIPVKLSLPVNLKKKVAGRTLRWLVNTPFVAPCRVDPFASTHALTCHHLYFCPPVVRYTTRPYL